jgi:hypothetical protein
MPELVPKEDARMCAAVVKEIARDLGLARDPVAVGRLTVSVARLYNRGLRDRGQLLDAAMQSVRALDISPPDKQSS